MSKHCNVKPAPHYRLRTAKAEADVGGNICLQKKSGGGQKAPAKERELSGINSCGGLNPPTKENAPSTNSFNSWVAHTNRTVR